MRSLSSRLDGTFKEQAQSQVNLMLDDFKDALREVYRSGASTKHRHLHASKAGQSRQAIVDLVDVLTGESAATPAAKKLAQAGDTYQGHHPDGSGVQQHSAGPLYPYVIFAQETPEGLKYGLIGGVVQDYWLIGSFDLCAAIAKMLLKAAGRRGV